MRSTAIVTSASDLSLAEDSDSESDSPDTALNGRQVWVSRKTSIARRSLTLDHASISRIFSSSQCTSANAWSLHDFVIASLKSLNGAKKRHRIFVRNGVPYTHAHAQNVIVCGQTPRNNGPRKRGRPRF